MSQSNRAYTGKRKFNTPQEDTKLNKLLDICDDNSGGKLIIFCEFRRNGQIFEQNNWQDCNVLILR